MWEAIADKAEFPFLHVLLDGIELFLFGNLFELLVSFFTKPRSIFEGQ